MYSRPFHFTGRSSTTIGSRRYETGTSMIDSTSPACSVNSVGYGIAPTKGEISKSVTVSSFGSAPRTRTPARGTPISSSVSRIAVSPRFASAGQPAFRRQGAEGGAAELPDTDWRDGVPLPAALHQDSEGGRPRRRGHQEYLPL